MKACKVNHEPVFIHYFMFTPFTRVCAHVDGKTVEFHCVETNETDAIAAVVANVPGAQVFFSTLVYSNVPRALSSTTPLADAVDYSKT
jgi:hypothetical protein